MTGFADAHIHFAEEGVSEVYPDIDDAELLLTCAAEYRHWKTQTETDDPRLVRFYGIHPWYHDQWNIRTKDELKGILERNPKAHVGEIGMDNKRPNLELQMTVFTSQVMIASEYGRSVNVHNQGSDGDIVRILKKHGKDCRSVILHSFKGPNVKPYSGLNCYFSLNARMFGKSMDKVKEAVLAIPEDRLLIESDAPFVSKNFGSMQQFIGTVSDLMGRTPEELIGLTLENARRSVE